MAVRYFEAGILFGVALDAARSIQAPLRAGGQRPALVSIVFSVVALEAFLNEATEKALSVLSSKHSSSFEPNVVSVFAEFMADAEKSRASLESKFILGNWILTGNKFDRGAPPYQDFWLLLRLRNDLVHFKPNEPFEQGSTPEEIHKNLIGRFSGKNILADNFGQSVMSWTETVQTKAVAVWSCETAAQMVADFVDKAPEGGWRNLLKASQLNFTIRR